VLGLGDGSGAEPGSGFIGARAWSSCQESQEISAATNSESEQSPAHGQREVWDDPDRWVRRVSGIGGGVCWSASVGTGLDCQPAGKGAHLAQLEPERELGRGIGKDAEQARGRG
jgi:hypothetical protein